MTHFRAHHPLRFTILMALAACGSRERPPAIEGSGTVEATQADLGFQLAGRLVELVPREGDQVAAGDRLGHLDASELGARRAAADAQLAAARAVLAELERGLRPEEVAQARLALAAADRRLEEQQRETARTVRLAEGGAVSREARERSETALAVAQADRDRLAQQAAVAEGGTREERIAAQRGLVRAAEAGVAQWAAVQDQTVLVAPFSGFVSMRHREPGEIVAPGVPILSLINPAERWVRVYIRQDLVGRLSLGTRVVITSDGFPGQEFAGEVAHIATEAEFTPRNVQTREERVRLVHAVRVRILGDEALALKPGLAADVRFPPGPP